MSHTDKRKDDGVESHIIDVVLPHEGESKEPSQDGNGRKPHSFSRRAFLGGALGAASLLLPRARGVLNGFILPYGPEEAYADSSTSPSAKVVVVSRGNVSVAVYDTSKTDRAYVPNATVTLKSLFNDVEKTVTADNLGVATFDITDMAEKDCDATSTGDPATDESYHFHGILTVSREGYREVYVGRAYFQDRTAVAVPTRPVQKGEVYLRQLSFDDWDIQYANVEFMSVVANDMTHTITAELALPGGKTYSILPYAVPTDTSDTSVCNFVSTPLKVSSTGVEMKSVSFTGQFLKKGANDAIPINHVIKLKIQEVGTSNVCDFTTGAVVKNGVFDYGMEETTAEGFFPVCGFNLIDDSDGSDDSGRGDGSSISDRDPISQINLHDETIPWQIPKSWPAPLGGMNCNIWWPDSGFAVVPMIPFKFMSFRFSLVRSNNRCSKTGNQNTSAWEDTAKTQKDFFDGFADWKNKVDGLMQNVNDLALSGQPVNKSFMKRWDANYSLDIRGYMDWDDNAYNAELSDFDGMIALAFYFMWKFSWVNQWVVGPVPLFITFDLAINVKVPLHVNWQAKEVSSLWAVSELWDKAEWLPKDSGGAIIISFTVGVNFGLGVAGVVSCSFRCQGYLCFSFDFNATLFDDSGKIKECWPRMLGSGGIELAFCVQFLIFSTSSRLVGIDGIMYDTRNKDLKDAATTASLGDDSERFSSPELEPDGDFYIDRASATASNDENTDFPAHAKRTFTIEDLRSFHPTQQADLAKRAELSSNGNPIQAVSNGIATASLGDEDVVTSIGSAASLGSGFKRVQSVSLGYAGAIVTAGLDDDAAATNPFTVIGDHVGPDATGLGSSLSTASISSIDDYGNVKPNSDNQILTDVFSDPHAKIFGLGGTSYMFRLACVSFGDEKSRTRVVWHRYDSDQGTWGDPTSVEFETPDGIDATREDLYDYEFDAKAIDESTIAVFISSGTRASGDEINVFEANAATMMTMVYLQKLNAAELWMHAGDLKPLASTTITSDEGGYYSLTQPKIIDRTGDSADAWKQLTEGYDGSLAVATYMVREASSSENLLLSGQHDTGLGITFCQLDPNGDEGNVLIPYTNWYKDIISPYAYDIVLGNLKIGGDNCYELPVGYMVDGQGCGVQTLKIHMPSNHDIFAAESLETIESVSLEKGAKLLTLSHCSGHDCFLASEDYFDYTRDLGDMEQCPEARTVMLSWADGSVSISTVGPNNTPANYLVAPNAKFLYYPKNTRGIIGQELGDDGELQDVNDELYYIMSMALIDGVYTDPFVFCRLDHPVDQLLAAESNATNENNMPVDDGETIMLATHITKVGESKAALHDIRIPLMRAAKAMEVSPVMGLVYPGEDNKFYVTIRNDGNTVLSGTTVQLWDDDTNTAIGEPVTINFADDEQRKLNTYEVASFNYDVDSMSTEAQGNDLVKEKGVSVLAPGKTGLYVASFPIPEDWVNKDSRNIHVVISDSSIIDPSAGTAGIVSLNSERDDFNLACDTTGVSVFDNTSVDGDELRDGAMAFTSDGDADDDDGDWADDDSKNADKTNRKNGKSDGSGSGSRGNLPRTGDSDRSAGLGLLGTAAVAAGAGMAAYSRRRTQLERERLAATGEVIDVEATVIEEDDE